MRRGTFKSTQTMHRALTESRKAAKREAQKRDWTEAAHLTEQDRNNLRSIKEYTDQLQWEMAYMAAKRLDTIVRDEIPSAIWTQMEEATTKYTAAMIRLAGKRLAEMDQDTRVTQITDDLLRLLHG